MVSKGLIFSSSFDIETAQASIAYGWISHRATAGSCISTALRASLWGFKSLEDHGVFIEKLYEVTKEDLKRCASKYFSKFFTNERVTCLTTSTGEQHLQMVKQFKNQKGEFCSLDFETVKYEDLEYL